MEGKNSIVAKTPIIFITDSYWPACGGIESTICSLSKSFADQYDIQIITHRNTNQHATLPEKTIFLPKIGQYSDPAGNPVFPLFPSSAGRMTMLPILLWSTPLIRRKYAPKLYDSLYGFYKAAFAGKVLSYIKNAAMVHSFSTSYLARCVSEICTTYKIPLVHSPYIHFGRWGDSPKLLEAYKQAHTVICPSHFFKEQLQKRVECNGTTRFEIIPPIIENPKPSRIHEPPVPNPFILFLGRREPHKGLPMLLVAYKGLEHMADLVIAGPGETFQTRSPSITDLGEVNDMIKAWLLSNCELLCVPSLDESFGMVYAEAMSYGKPVVAIDTPPLNEIIEPELTGLLVRPDDTDALRMALGRLLLDKRLHKEIGEAAKRAYKERFSPERIIRRILEVYKAAMGKE
jgi:glycosyltransferase involved in cell wall biosynthesis